MSLDAMVGRDKATGSFCRMDRSELDDLLDEILGDQLFANNFPSQCREEGPMINGKQRANTTMESANEMTQQYRSHIGATNGAIPTPNQAQKIQAKIQMPVDSYRRKDQGRGSELNPPRMYGQKSEESQMLPGGRSRAPSLPANNAAFDRRRLQSVPCNDYYGQMQNSQNYYAAGSDRFVHGMCSEEPITWLDQQKMKLRTRQEGKHLVDQSTQQKQLMDELKSAQLMCAQKHAEHTLLDNTIEQYAEYINSRSTQGQSPAREGLSYVPAMGNGDLGVRQSVSPSLSLQSEATIVSNEENKGLCKSEHSYYVSGIERPPFTTHQTKYVFSVSSPHVSGANPGSMSPMLQLMQKNSTKCSPPVPQRGESSREAMKQSNMVHDWELEQWEQESHTSLSSRSDATEKSVVIPNVEKTMAVRMWSAENHAQHNAPVSTAILRHEALSVGTSEDTSAGSNASVNWSAPNGDLRPTSMAAYAPYAAVPRKVPATVSYSSGNVTTSSTAYMLHESSPSSALSSSYHLPPQYYDAHLSRNHSESKAFEAVPRPSIALSSFRPNGSFSSSAATALSQPRSMMSLSAAPPTVRPMPVASNSMVSNGMVPNGMPPNGMTPTAMTTPNAVPEAAVVPTAMMPNVGVPTAVEPAMNQIPTMPYNSFMTAKKSDANMNNTQNWQLASIAEQPSLSETSEVISLQLIGPGMQKLEPDGTLPAVRPVTPKFPHPGMDGGFSLVSQPAPGVGQRRYSEDRLLNPPNYSSLRRATVTAYNQPSATSGTHNDVNGGGVEFRPRSANVLQDEEKPEKKIQNRRSAASDSLELFPSSGSSGCSNSLPSAYHRTERLLSADFTAQGMGRRTSLNQGERSRRDARRQSEFDNLGRRPSEIHHFPRHLGADLPDGLDDVFANKTGLETRPAVNGNRRRSYVGMQNNEDFNLEMLDTALAGLQASANSTSDDRGPSQEVLQSPQSGKTTPGFYSGLGGPQSSSGTLLQPFGKDPQSSSTSADVPTSLKTSQAPRFVQDSSKYWHKPNIARDEVIAYLKDKPPGTFIIRSSNSFPGAFGLALKVAHLPPNVHSRGGDPEAELVRHFLIEPTLKGVKLKGCSSEPVFGSLAALVYQHSLTPLSLPCKLIIPDLNNLKALETVTAGSGTTASEVLSQGAACNVVYINSVDMESLTGFEAINKAVATTFKQTPAPLTTLVHFKVSSQGVTLTDTNRRLFFRRHYPTDTVTFAGMDPEHRNWTWTNEETKASVTAKIFGFVARKQGSSTDNACHIFAELDADQPGDAIVEFIMKIMLGRGRSKQDSV